MCFFINNDKKIIQLSAFLTCIFVNFMLKYIRMDYHSQRLFKSYQFLKKFTLFCLILVNYLFRPAAKQPQLLHP